MIYTKKEIYEISNIEGNQVMSSPRMANAANMDITNMEKKIFNALESLKNKGYSSDKKLIYKIQYCTEDKKTLANFVVKWPIYCEVMRTSDKPIEDALNLEWAKLHMPDEYKRRMDSKNIQVSNDEEERVITLLEIVSIINKEEREKGEVDSKNQPKTRHASAMKKIEKLAEEPYFGRPLKIGGRVKTGVGYKNIETYSLTKNQAIAAASKLSNKHLMFVIEKLDKALKKVGKLNDNIKKVQLPDLSDPIVAHREFARLSLETAKLLEEKDKAINVIAHKDKVIKSVKEKAIAASRMSKDAGESSVREFTKILNIQYFGQNKCYKWLRDNKYLMKNNEPYQKWIDRGWFGLKPYNDDLERETSFKPTLTPLGRLELSTIISRQFIKPILPELN